MSNYKIVSIWSAPRPEEAEAFDAWYMDVHVPLARKLPGLADLVITRTPDGIPGGAAEFYSVAELVFADRAGLEQAAASPEWAALGADGQEGVARFGVTLRNGCGTPLLI